MKRIACRELWISVSLVLVALLCAAALPRAGAAQSVPPIEVIAVEHVATGQVHVTIRVDRPETFDASRVQARIDGLIASHVTVETLPRINTAVVLAVDTSGSMQGAPIEAARRALLDFVALVPRDNLVALVTFADRAQTVVPFTTNRAQLLDAIGRLQAQGNTSLYDAVTASAQLVRESDAGRRQIVLLSDGLDSGGTSLSSREASISVAQQSGAQFIAVGLGSQIDGDYLGALAAATGGTTRFLSNEQTLGDVFRAHGGRLSATHSVNVPVGVSAPGTHRVTIEAHVAGLTVTVTREFTVSNDGLLRLRFAPERSSPEQSVLVMESAVPLGGIELQASSGALALPVVAQGQRVLVDHWVFSPGRHEISVAAMRAGVTLARGSSAIDVPPLPPRIEVHRAEGGTSATWWAQPSTQPLSLRLLVDGAEHARYEPATQGMAIELPRSGRVEVLLLAGEVELARTQLEAAPETSLAPVWAGGGLVALLGLLGGWAVGWRARRGRTTAQVRPLRPRRRIEALRTSNADRAEASAMLVVEGTHGARQFALQQRPLTLGSASDCDVVIAEAAVRPLHARVALLPDGGVRIHTLQGSGSHPIHGWTRLTPGESMQIGSHTVRLEGERSA